MKEKRMNENGRGARERIAGVGGDLYNCMSCSMQ